MADPRATPGYDGIRSGGVTYVIDNSTITFDATKAGGSAAVGKAVTLSANKTVALCADGDPVLGKLKQVNWDNTCTVEESPGAYVTLPAGNGATVTAGKKIVGALGASSAKGYIRNAADPGASFAQAAATDQAAARHLIIDAGTASAVVVRLG